MSGPSLGGDDPLEKEMATTHSSIFAWEIPWTEEPAGLQSTGLQRVEHNWGDLVCMHRLLLAKNELASDFLLSKNEEGGRAGALQEQVCPGS